MREYNLFILKKEYYDLYNRKPELLYESLSNLYNLKNCFNYGITLYEQLCNKVAKDAIRYYLNNRYSVNYEDIFPFKEATITLKYSRIIVKSKYNLPNILKIFNRYNRNIFVCDFENNDYFFLETFVRSKVLQTN